MRCCWISTARYSWSIQRGITGFGSQSAGRPLPLIGRNGLTLTLHGPDGSRLVGFDNVHAVRESQGPGGKSRGPRDHKHRMETVRPYRFKDAATLLEDFWAEVDGVLREKGVI